MKYEKLTEILMESLKDTYYKSPITNYAFFLQGEHKLLNHLYICGEVYKKPAELCRELYMTSARVSAALKILEKKGYIKRRASQKDKRKVMVLITDNGKEYIENVRKSVFNEMKTALMNMGEDADEFVSLIKRAAEIINKSESELIDKNEHE